MTDLSQFAGSRVVDVEEADSQTGPVEDRLFRHRPGSVGAGHARDAVPDTSRKASRHGPLLQSALMRQATGVRPEQSVGAGLPAIPCLIPHEKLRGHGPLLQSALTPRTSESNAEGFKSNAEHENAASRFRECGQRLERAHAGEASWPTGQRIVECEDVCQQFQRMFEAVPTRNVF